MTKFIDEITYAGKQNVNNMAFDMDAYLDQKMIREIEEYANEQRKKMDAEIEQGLWKPVTKLKTGIYIKHRGSLWSKA